MPLIEVNGLPVDTALVSVERPNEVVCAVPTVEPVAVEVGERLIFDVTGVVPKNLNKKEPLETVFCALEEKIFMKTW